MKLINPIGRSVGANGSAKSPRACMCGESMGESPKFASARGSNDTCWHCGCDCTGSIYNSGNRSGAATSPWKSK